MFVDPTKTARNLVIIVSSPSHATRVQPQPPIDSLLHGCIRQAWVAHFGRSEGRPPAFCSAACRHGSMTCREPEATRRCPACCTCKRREQNGCEMKCRRSLKSSRNKGACVKHCAALREAIARLNGIQISAQFVAKIPIHFAARWHTNRAKTRCRGDRTAAECVTQQ